MPVAMSLTDALSVAVTGLKTSSAASQVIANNVSNAQTEGYTAKTVALAEIINSNGFGGVGITSYNRASNTVLTATMNSAQSKSSYLSIQSGYMEQIQSILNSSGNPPVLADALNKFQAAWTEYAASPSDTTLQKTVLSTAETLASTITSIASQVAALRTSVETDFESSVDELNAALREVQEINTQISKAMANGVSTVNLEDQRDRAINVVAKYTSVNVIARTNGQVALYTPGGTALLDGASQTFSIGSDPLTGDTCIVNAVGSNVNAELAGGVLQAQTDFLSTAESNASGVSVINKLETQLLAFANMFISPAVGGFANTYDSATTSTGEQASQFFTANTDADGNVSDLTSFSVNINLKNGTTSVKQAAAIPLSEAFAATNLAIDTSGSPPVTTNIFTANGLTIRNQTYAGIATAIISGFQQAANTIQNQSSTATTQLEYYKSTISDQTGVNTDAELINLTAWQNSYAASAHVISIIQSMMKTLEEMVL